MNYHNITKDDMKNGDGLRVVLWVSGCDHHCAHCQNPVTWDPDDGLKFDMAALRELFDALSNDYTAGITFSGGDPLNKNNLEEISHLIGFMQIGFPDKTIWMYTGYTWEEIMASEPLKSVVRYVDVLVDGRFIEELKSATYPWAGSTNQRVIDVQESLRKGDVVLHESH